jgi:dipeptidyl aminopeptidase/acylaminoacyl peptidase
LIIAEKSKGKSMDRYILISGYSGSGKYKILNPLVRLLSLTIFFLAACSQPTTATPLTIAHPDDPAAKIEYFIEQPDGKGPRPTVVFLHGFQQPAARIGGRAFVNWGVLRRYSNEGYLAVSVSLPGFGGSTGQEDFAGPFAQSAVRAVLDKLVADQKAQPNKIVIQGVSLGAVTGALVGANDNRISGLVLISGLYDFPAYFGGSTSTGASSVKMAIDRQTGGGNREALIARSALRLAGQIKAQTLILNGAKDDRTSPEQAAAFADAINQAGGRAQVHIYPDLGHEIPVSARDGEVHAFIDSVLK